VEDIHVFRIPRTVVTGWGCLARLPEVLLQLKATRVLIVTDRGVMAAGLLERVKDQLQRTGVASECYADTVSEPPFDVAVGAAELARTRGCDAIVGVGGGSSIDCAKAAALIATDTGLATRLREKLTTPIGNRGLPTVMVPTTAGTGSEVTGIAVFTDERQGMKAAIATPYIIPDAAVVDPELTLSVPARVTAFTGMDALTHAIEAFVSVNASPLTDLFARRAMTMIARNLRGAVADGANRSARTALAEGSLAAGIAFANAGVAAVHALAYPVGGRTHMAHGLCNSILLPYVMAASYVANLARYAEISELMGEAREPSLRAQAIRGIHSVLLLAHDTGLPTDLRTNGITQDDIPSMAVSAFAVKRLLDNNPKQLNVKEIETIYADAYAGTLRCGESGDR
jgi:alcohol dehydrogenase class IV